jgi:hypothetical protein
LSYSGFVPLSCRIESVHALNIVGGKEYGFLPLCITLEIERVLGEARFPPTPISS